MTNAKLKKIFLITTGGILLLLLILILCLSPIVKHLVEKHDLEYTGREITMDNAYVNPVTGYIHFSDLKIFEHKSDSVFISASGISLNISLYKLFDRIFEINKVTLDDPIVSLIQTKKLTNIDDLLEKFKPKDTIPAKDPFRFSILHVKINNGTFLYHEKEMPINYFIKQVNIESSGKHWDIDTIATTFSFVSGPGTGSIKGYISINSDNLNYRLKAVMNKFDLQLIEQYLKDLSNYGTVRASIDAAVYASGNFKEKENLNAKGTVVVNDFHFGKNKTEDYTSFSKLVLKVDELSPKAHKYLFDSLSLSDPYLKFEKYDYLNNVETMFGKKGANVKQANADEASFNLILEIAEYVKVLAQNFFESDYKINRLAIYRGNLKFNDFSQTEKFAMALHPLNFIADSIHKNKERVEAHLRSSIEPYGFANLKLSIDPKNNNNFNLSYNFGKIPATMFNPYIISYTSFPLDKGTVELKGNWDVKEGIIKSDNHFLVIDPRVGSVQLNNDSRWIPLRVAMFFVRERANVIDYEIPITGNLKDPNFKLWDVIIDLIENIVIKPPTTGYSVSVRKTEKEVEKSLMLKWEFRHDQLRNNEERFVYKIAEYLKENPELSISIHPNQFKEKEKEYILFFEAKKKYFLKAKVQKNPFLFESDSMAIHKMSVKDSSFVQYLDKHVKDTLLFTIQEKCRRLVGDSIVDQKYDQLQKRRENNFLNYFKENDTEKRVKIFADKTKIPYNGFPFYEIKYKGELPKEVMRAYKRINEFNNEAPRNKYSKKRKNPLIIE